MAISGNLGHMDVNQFDLTAESGADVAHVASCVGHHVINAFAAVVSNAELLKLALENRATIDKESLATTIIEAALEASHVARRLIDYSRPITYPGKGTLRLDQVLSDYFDERRTAFPLLNWRTELVEVPAIVGSIPQIRHMLDCLVENSIEAISSTIDPFVLAHLLVDSRGWLELELQDSGCGMTTVVMERAVEPFFTTKYGHIGVGLSIANRIWRRHGGTLSIRSRPGEGTTFRLCVDPHPEATGAFARPPV